MNERRRGFLLVMIQPPPAMEEEFNAWYDTEHLPERMTVPGFLSGHRFVCTSGHPRYLAIYDLNSVDVLNSAEYLAVSAERFSPWTRRVAGRSLVYRTAGTQIYPGDGVTSRATRLLVLRLRGVEHSDQGHLTNALRRIYEDKPETVALRIFECNDTPNHFAFIELRAPIQEATDIRSLGRFADSLDMMNTYAPYDPRI